MNQFNWRLAFLLGFAGVLTNTFWVAFNAYVPIFLQSGHPLASSSAVVGFALSPFISNFIMTWDNIIHMFLNPWIGAKSDKTWNRWGRRKPWLLVGFPIALVGFMLIPYATSLVAIMLFILLTNLGTGLYRAPTRAWLGDFFVEADRPRAESFMHVLGGLALIIVALGGGRLFDTLGRAAPFWLTACIMIAAFILMVLKVKERKPNATVDAAPSIPFLGFLQTLRGPQNRNIRLIVLTVFLYMSAHAAFQANLTPFSVFELNVTVGRAAQLLGISVVVYVIAAVLSGFLATRFGSRRVMLVGIGLYAFSSLLIIQFGVDERTFLLPFLLTGLAYALVNVNTLPLLLNLDNENRFGLFTGLFFFAFQAGNIAGPVMAGLFIAVSGTQRAMLVFVAIGMLAAFCVLRLVEE